MFAYVPRQSVSPKGIIEGYVSWFRPWVLLVVEEYLLDLKIPRGVPELILDSQMSLRCGPHPSLWRPVWRLWPRFLGVAPRMTPLGVVSSECTWMMLGSDNKTRVNLLCSHSDMAVWLFRSINRLDVRSPPAAQNLFLSPRLLDTPCLDMSWVQKSKTSADSTTTLNKSRPRPALQHKPQ